MVASNSASKIQKSQEENVSYNSSSCEIFPLVPRRWAFEADVLSLAAWASGGVNRDSSVGRDSSVVRAPDS